MSIMDEDKEKQLAQILREAEAAQAADRIDPS